MCYVELIITDLTAAEMLRSPNTDVVDFFENKSYIRLLPMTKHIERVFFHSHLQV